MPRSPITVIATATMFALPLALLTTRSGAEILIAAIDSLFLVHLIRTRNARKPGPVVLATAAWWAWTVFVSARQLPSHGPHALIQSVLMGRFFLLAAAGSDWLLAGPAARRALAAIVAASAAWIGLQCWQQYLLGTDIFGWPRWGDGALTGPFKGPKAGPALVLILFPAMLPPVMALVRQRAAIAKAAGGLLAASGVATMVLIGQRMPAVLTVLGLLACAILLRPLRLVVLATACLAAALLAATPLIAPPTFAKLVGESSGQLSHFSQSPYGLIYTRAAVIALAHPWFGLGFDGFRTACDATRYQHGIAWLGIPDHPAAGPAGCNIHPHNHYLEAATAGGVPGLALFCALVLTWLTALGRGLAIRPDAERAGLFIAILLALWPLASTSAFFTLPNAGWTFLLLGWGLALSRPYAR